jgi:hypothetical protein
VPLFTFALSYGTAVLAEAFIPLLRDTKLPNYGGGIAVRVDRAIAMMQLSSIREVPVVDIVLFAPAGAFAVAALSELGVSYRSAWIIVAMLGAMLCGALEVLHGVGSFPIELGAWLTHTLAIGVAAWGAARWLPHGLHRLRGTRRPRAVLLGYSIVLLCWSWRPFVPKLDSASIASHFTAVHWIPLFALAQRFDLFTVTDIITQFALYLPLGALLAVWPLRTEGRWSHLWPAIYLATVGELGKILLAERFFDITHILLQIAGAAIGWVIVRGAGFAPYGEVWETPPAAQEVVRAA